MIDAVIVPHLADFGGAARQDLLGGEHGFRADIGIAARHGLEVGVGGHADAAGEIGVETEGRDLLERHDVQLDARIVDHALEISPRVDSARLGRRGHIGLEAVMAHEPLLILDVPGVQPVGLVADIGDDDDAVAGGVEEVENRVELRFVTERGREHLARKQNVLVSRSGDRGDDLPAAAVEIDRGVVLRRPLSGQRGVLPRKLPARIEERRIDEPQAFQLHSVVRHEMLDRAAAGLVGPDVNIADR